MTIGEKRIEKIAGGVGPGEYSPERADSVTKVQSVAVKIDANSPTRSNITFANVS